MAKPLFAGIRLPFSAGKTVIAGDGVADALLVGMYHDPAVYFVGAKWAGPKTLANGHSGRWAVYTLRRKTASDASTDRPRPRPIDILIIVYMIEPCLPTL